LIQDDLIACRYDQLVDLLDENGQVLSSLAAAVVVDFHYGEGAERVAPSDEKAIRKRLVPGAWNIAYPYVREAVHTMSTRLGLGPIALGVLGPRDVVPQDVHVRGVAEYRGSSSTPSG
jgi:hypothetical protein